MNEWRPQPHAEALAHGSREAERALAVIWPLLGRHVAFHRRLVDLTASVKAALMLSQTIYWTRHGRDIARTGGWFLKTVEQWALETGLSLKEQATARAALRGLSLVDERRVGVPAKLHFRLDADRLGELLTARLGRPFVARDWLDAAVMAECLGPAVAFHRSLAQVGGGVHAGLMLSRALHLTRLHARRQLAPWVCNSETSWREALGLTRREQETARRHLARTGIWEERLSGIPPRLYARVRLEGLISRLADGGPSAPRIGVDPGSPGCGVATHRLARNGESRPRDVHTHESPERTNQSRPNRNHSIHKSADPHMEESTSESVQPLHSAEDMRIAAAGTGGGLVFPEQLRPEERIAAEQLLRCCAHQAQALLDELSGRLEAKAVRSSPVAYLRGLVNRAVSGTFVPELGLQVAAARRRRVDALALRQQRALEAQRLNQERRTPEYEAKAAARREDIRRLLESASSTPPPKARS